MNLIWRFYRDDHRKWRWQQMTAGQEIVTESPAGHADYDHCVADARKRGYVLESSPPGQGPQK